jgi:hypothetical protein
VVAPVPFCRTPKDVVLSAAYQWYISQFQPGAHPPAPEGREGFASLSNWLAKCYAVAAINDIRVHPQVCSINRVGWRG